MQFKEIVAPSMKELFIDNIEYLILSGELAVGEKLPTERDLATQMKVSRTIVNLGLAELARKGFIEVHPRKGVYVADYIKTGNLETLLSIVRFNGGVLDNATFASISEFRRIFEGESYKLAAENRTQGDLEELFGLLQKANAYKTKTELCDSIFQFHHAVICMSKNRIFPLVHNGFESTLKRSTRLVLDNAPVQFALDGIFRLYGKVKECDGEGAKQAIIDIVNQGSEYISGGNIEK